MSSFDLAIPVILKHEGGFVNNKLDPGGATNYGISLRYLKSLGIAGDINSDGDVDSIDIKQMPIEKASAIYKAFWWNKYNYGRIDNQSVATKLFDMAINMGQKQATILAQNSCTILSENTSLICDGVLGPTTVNLINSLDPGQLLAQLRNECKSFYLKLINKNPSFQEFETGWLARAAS